VIGGFLYAVDPVWPYVAMAALLVIAGAAMVFVRYERRPKSEGQTAGVRDALEGLRFIRRTPILLGAISLDLFAVLFGGAIALLPAIATDRLGVGAVGLGWLRAAGGIGASLTTLFITRRPVRKHVGRVLLTVVSVFGAFTIVLGLTRSFAIAFVAMAALSGADAVSVFIRSTLVPLVAPFDKRGRVLAVETVFIGASNELGGFESGVAGQLIGTAGAVVLGGAATLVVAGVYAAAVPALRNLDRFPTLTQETRATGTAPDAPDGGG
jgi:predicted MFS family arabinose efflux permease